MLTYDAFEIGTIVYMPDVRHEEVPVTCPDCKDTRHWNVSTPGGNSFKVLCPRCHIGSDNWHMKPKRYVQELRIKELTVTGITMTRKQDAKTKEITVHVAYHTEPHMYYSIDADKVYGTLEAAEWAGKKLLEKQATEDEQRWEEERQRIEKRAGTSIVHFLNQKADAAHKDLQKKVDKLRERMLAAIADPDGEGPKSRSLYRGGPQEITSEAMESWLCEMLDDAGIPTWSEQELHEAKCQC